MVYKIIYSEVFSENFSRLDKKLKSIVLRKILRLTENPKVLGKVLKGPLRGLWELKVSKYRVIYRIIEEQRKVLVETIDSRGRVFKRFSLR
jgi:mRNA interferase RelE/StbE